MQRILLCSGKDQREDFDEKMKKEQPHPVLGAVPHPLCRLRPLLTDINSTLTSKLEKYFRQVDRIYGVILWQFFLRFFSDNGRPIAISVMLCPWHMLVP